MLPRHIRVFASVASVFMLGCTNTSPTAPVGVGAGSTGGGTRLVRETLASTISASGSPQCADAFRRSVDVSYFQGGTGRCVEFRRRSSTAGIIAARLTWPESRLDLDLVLNDGVGMNFRQSIAANRCCETIEFFVNANTDFVFVVYLRGIDPQFVANGGVYSGPVATPFTLEVERPE